MDIEIFKDQCKKECANSGGNPIECINCLTAKLNQHYHILIGALLTILDKDGTLNTNYKDIIDKILNQDQSLVDIFSKKIVSQTKDILEEIKNNDNDTIEKKYKKHICNMNLLLSILCIFIANSNDNNIDSIDKALDKYFEDLEIENNNDIDR